MQKTFVVAGKKGSIRNRTDQDFEQTLADNVSRNEEGKNAKGANERGERRRRKKKGERSCRKRKWKEEERTFKM